MHKHTNALVHETSPYLLQHAHNPVNWYPWGEEALSKAKQEDKPILVSIGYAACHWCHVMERESFENEDTAAIMNSSFINIKIDREERPDIDHIYMDAVQAMTGSGGWPLNVFLTPDCKPFYGGTYFPPVRAFNRSSWREVLHSIHEAYTQRKTEIESQAENLTEHLRTSNAFGISGNESGELNFTKETLAEITTNILKSADKLWGGFGAAPKFPQTFIIQFLLRQYYYTKDEAARNQALLSLDKMIYGGIYDQLGGGFARYSTDAEWLAPHFEKMLYDNALLLSVIAEAYQLTKKEIYYNTIIDTMDFLKREMLHEEGGFYSALDADSEGIEGKFYVWNKQEIDEILKNDSKLFCEFYDVNEQGNWEHTNILRILKPLNVFAEEKGLEGKDLSEVLDHCKKLLLQHRESRVRPSLDDKILLSWNALMNTACSKAYSATGREEYKELAIKNMQFLEENFVSVDGEWSHTYKNKIAKYPAFLDDYAYLIQAYIHLQELTGEVEYLKKAETVTEYVIANFEDSETGFFFFTHRTQRDVIVRKKEIYDGATPAGNSIMASNLHYLSIVFNRDEWAGHFTKLLDNVSGVISRYPTSFGWWGINMQNYIFGLSEIVVVGKNANQIILPILHRYIPNRILQSLSKQTGNFPLFEGKQIKNEVEIYLCKKYSCQQPVNTVEQLVNLLEF